MAQICFILDSETREKKFVEDGIHLGSDRKACKIQKRMEITCPWPIPLEQ